MVQPQNTVTILRQSSRTESHLVDERLTGGVHRLLQLGCVDFDVLAEGLTGLGQVQTGLGWTMHDHQLSGLHLIDNLLDGVAVRAALVVYVRYPRSEKQHKRLRHTQVWRNLAWWLMGNKRGQNMYHLQTLKIADLISRFSILEMHLVGTTERSWSMGSSPLVNPESSLLFSSSVACSSGTRNSSSLYNNNNNNNRLLTTQVLDSPSSQL